MLTRIAELHGAHRLSIAGLSKPEHLPVRTLPLLLIATQLLVARIALSPATHQRWVAPKPGQALPVPHWPLFSELNRVAVSAARCLGQPSTPA